MRLILCFLLMLLYPFLVFSDGSNIEDTVDAYEGLCSPEGLMQLVPELKNENGKFQVPDPTKNLDKFLKVHNALSNIILASLVKANIAVSLREISSQARKPLMIGKKWRSSELGLATNGQALSYPDGGHFASYGGPSFMNNVEPVPNTSDYFYAITADDKAKTSIIYIQPTVLACVDRLDLAAANTAGIWTAPSYALGSKKGDAFLIVNKCVDLAKVALDKGQKNLLPDAKIYTAIQWADTDQMSHMRTKQKGHTH